MPGPMIPSRLACPACWFIERRCPLECPLSKHFPPESRINFELALMDVPNYSVTDWLQTRIPVPDRPARAREIVEGAASRGDAFSQQAREVLVEAVLSEVARRDAAPHHNRGPNGLPILYTYVADFLCCVPDLVPLEHQLQCCHAPLNVQEFFGDDLR